MSYVRDKAFTYSSDRYHKSVTVPKGYVSDGATWAIDIKSDSWWVHDKLCDTGRWDDGSACSNWQASTVLSDILRHEGRYIRAQYWRIFTWLFGGGQARTNGMW